MLDLGFVRQNLDLVRRKVRDRGMPDALDNFARFDQERRRLISEVDELRAVRNKNSDGIAKLKLEQKKGMVPAGSASEANIKIAERDKKEAELVEQSRRLGDEIADKEREAKALDERVRQILEQVPNLAHDSAPVGKASADNREVRRWGEPREFNFQPKAHWDLGPALGILDFERAAKISGARFAVYKGAGARLERSLANFMLDLHTREHGYTEILPPFLVSSATLYGTGQLPKFAGDLFKLEGHDLWLIPTAEVPLTNLFRDEILDAEKLPVKFCAWTACFRSEAGSYGKDTRGIIRQHQFQKVELVKFSLPENSYEEHESLTRDAEAVLKRLGLPYRVVELCTGDLGFSSAKTYDLEVWLPSAGEYKEISSCSNCEAFQARRANLRFRRTAPKGQPAKGQPKTEFLHTLNGSGLAVGRTWLAILENYQQADGSVVIPEALRPYLDGLERIVPPQKAEGRKQ